MDAGSPLVHSIGRLPIVKKQDVLDLVNQLPDEIDTEKLIDELYVRAKLEKAERAVADGRVLSQEEVVRRSRQWQP